MNPLQRRLAALRRRLRLVVGMRGVSLVCATLLLAAAGTGLIDWRVHLPGLVRAVLLTGSLAAAGVLAIRYLLLPLKARADDLSLALKVEARYPSLNDALASAVQFLEQQRVEEEPLVSPSLRRQAVQRAMQLAKGYDFRPVIDARGTRTATVSFIGAAGLALALCVFCPDGALTAFLRLADPFGKHDWPLQTQLFVEARPRIGRGEPFEIHATISGVIPERATIEYRLEQTGAWIDAYDIRKKDDAADAILLAHVDTGRVQRDFRFQVHANDAVSPWFDVQVLPPPQLVPLGGQPSPRVWLEYPRYTDLPPLELPSGTTSIEAPAGTRMLLRGAVDRPIARAWLEYPPEAAPPMRLLAILSVLGQAPSPGSVPTHLLTAVGEYVVAGVGAWRRIPARVEGDGLIFSLEATARLSGTFALHFEDELGIGGTRLVELRTIADPAPSVTLLRPSPSQDSLDVLPDAAISLQVQAEDPLYAIRSVGLELRRRRSEDSTGVSEHFSLYNHELIARAGAPLFALLPGAPLHLPALPIRPRPQHISIEKRWSLAPLGLQEGDLLTIQASADDFDDVTVGKQPGRSHEIELRVVSRLTLDLATNEMEAQIQQELLRLKKQQQEARDKVIPAETHWRNNKGPLQPQHLDDLLQAEQLQQQIRSRVGTPEEGLRAAVARAQQTLRDNHVPRSGTQDRLDAVAAELDRLAREELEQIEPRLTEARKESAEKDSQSHAGKTALTEARKHQEEVEKTFSELLRLLEPWSSTREVKGEAKSILQDQRQLAGQTAKLAEKIGPGEESDKLDPAVKAEIERAAELQSKLADRISQLRDKMERLAQTRQSQDPDSARALKEAVDKEKETNAAGKMAEAAKSILANNLAKAGNEQRDSARAMEDVVKALDERREEELDRLIKKMKEADEKLSDLAERQERLQGKTREAQQITDPVERQEALKRLAREQEQIQREAQEMVRELSRLRGERAGQALSQAAGKMGQAGQRMGGDSEGSAEQQDQALDRLNDAQSELQEAREEVQEELAREKLVKIADQVRGLRERQESFLTESGRIQRQVLQGKRWTRVLKISLIGLSENQKALGDETSSVAYEKLEGTKVFVHLLTKSADAMRQAAARMEARRNASDPAEPAAGANENGINLSAEETADAETQKLQRLALRRIDQLLDALKSAASNPGSLAASRRPAQKPSSDKPSEQSARDNSPPLDQLRVLRDLQQELNERTQAFSKQHRDLGKLNQTELAELQAIRQEQQEVTDLFHELTAPGEAQGEKP